MNAAVRRPGRRSAVFAGVGVSAVSGVEAPKAGRNYLLHSFIFTGCCFFTAPDCRRLV